MADNFGAVRKHYKKLIGLYPPAFRDQLGESMEQTFADLYHERVRQGGRGLFGFALWMFIETVVGIIKEYMLLITQGDVMKNIISNPKPAALIGFLFTTPFMLLNTIAGNQIEPFYTIFKINTAGAFWDYPVGHISAIVALLLLPLGAFVAIRPVFQQRKVYALNLMLALILLCLFVLISTALAEEIYRCNVLLIPNCD